MRMGKVLRLVVVAVVAFLAVFTFYTVIVARSIGRPKKPVFVPMAEVQEQFRRETTRATQTDVEIAMRPVALEEIVFEATAFDRRDVNSTESRRAFCVELFQEAGYEPTIRDNGDVFATKRGRRTGYVVVGAHYDKVDGPSRGILDNMLGCILVCNIAEAVLDESTDYTYVFLAYCDEETGRKIGVAAGGCWPGRGERPTFVIEIDYVGDRVGELGARWITPMAGRFLKTGIKLTTVPMPDPMTIHTAQDNLGNVDFDQAYLAYRTAISLIEGIERGEGLIPPETVNFWREGQPLFGQAPGN